ncbi:MAG TPA: DUF5666 domain-containing protein [Terracidiphilus sp.]|nr:DUF5666 domain-containing protein [Terracidiphilus sp.]
MPRPGLKHCASCVFSLFIFLAIGAGCGVTAASAAAQDSQFPVLRGYITALVPPNDFVVDGYHVVTSVGTTYQMPKGGPNQPQYEIRTALRVGSYVEVRGTKDRSTKTVAAFEVLLRDKHVPTVSGAGVVERETVSGAGVIERVTVSGPGHLFHVDGYDVLVDSGTQTHFAGGLTGIGDVGTNMWVRFEGQRNSSGEVVASTAHFVKPKFPRHKRDPRAVQVTTFPPGSLIDFDGSFRTDREKHRLEDAGGWCGWYPVPEVPALQERIRRIGMREVPEFERNLPDDDPSKIPFRFYVVVEKDIRSEIYCSNGLVVVPLDVVERLQNDDQLAAVLADGIAAQMQMQQERLAHVLGVAGVEFASYYVAGITGYEVAKIEIRRKMERQHGALALSLMADAGYDPWQAPEAWRLLKPRQLPRNLKKLKYPARSKYLLEILRLQYAAKKDEAKQPAHAEAGHK